MIRVVIGVFLILHGILHPAIYAAPVEPDKDMPFDPRRSWALTAAHFTYVGTARVGEATSVLVAAVYVASGVALLAGTSWWIPLAVAGAAAGLAFKGLYFHPWLSIGVLLDVVVLIAAGAGWFGEVSP